MSEKPKSIAQQWIDGLKLLPCAVCGESAKRSPTVHLSHDIKTNVRKIQIRCQQCKRAGMVVELPSFDVGALMMLQMYLKNMETEWNMENQK